MASKSSDANGQSLAYFYARENDNDANIAGVLIMDEARRWRAALGLWALRLDPSSNGRDVHFGMRFSKAAVCIDLCIIATECG